MIAVVVVDSGFRRVLGFSRGLCDPDGTAACGAVELRKVVARVVYRDRVAHGWQCRLADWQEDQWLMRMMN